MDESQALWNAVKSAERLIVTLSRILILNEHKIELGSRMKDLWDERRGEWNTAREALPSNGFETRD